MEEKKEKSIHPLLIIFITVLFVMLLIFLIMYFDWWRDYEPPEVVEYPKSFNYLTGVRNHIYFKQPSGLITERY